MNNLNSILDYLKVFNNINKRPAYEPRSAVQEPRNMAQGPRTGFKDGNGVYDEKDLLGKRVRELMDEGYDFGEAVKQAMKEGYAEGGRIGFYRGESVVKSHGDQIVALGEAGESSASIAKKLKLKQQTVNSAINSIEKGLAGENYKFSKPFKDIAKLKVNQWNKNLKDPKYIEILKERISDPKYKNYNYKDLVREGIITDREYRELSKLDIKAQFEGPHSYVPKKKGSEKRTKWTKEFSDVTTEGKLAGPKKSGLELSHLGSKTGLVTPNNLAYLPKYTNKLSYHRFEKILNGIQTDQRKILADSKMTMDAKRKALAELAKADRTLRNKFKGLGYDKIKTRIKTKAFAWGIGEKEVLKDPTIAIGKGETGANVALKKASKAEKAKIVEMGKNRLNKFLKEVASKDSKAAQRVITQLNSGIPINQIMEELARVPGMKKLARGFMKVGGPWEVGFAAVDFANNLYSMDPDEAFKTTMSDVTFGLYEGGQREAMETLNDAAAEIGHSNKGFNSYKEIMDLNKLLESEKEKLKKLNAKKGKFPDEEIDWMIKSSEKFIPRLQKEIDSKVESFIQDEDYENIIKSYDQTVNYVARKQYNKNVEDRKNLVNTDMNVIGSSVWSAITEPIKTILPQNLMETTSVTRPYVRALRKTPFVGKFFDPTSKEAKLSAMSKEEKIKRAIELNAVRQNYHPVTGNTMTYGQMEPYYDKYYAEGGIASLMKKKW